MKLGLLTAPFPDTELMAVADWAASSGFSALEVACWPAGGGEARRYATGRSSSSTRTGTSKGRTKR